MLRCHSPPQPARICEIRAISWQRGSHDRRALQPFRGHVASHRKPEYWPRNSGRIAGKRSGTRRGWLQYFQQHLNLPGSVELYQLSTGKWSFTASMRVPTIPTTPILLPNSDCPDRRRGAIRQSRHCHLGRHRSASDHCRFAHSGVASQHRRRISQRNEVYL